MTGAEDYLKEIIRLQLKKPRNWNWELSTSRSSPHISLPTIQLYNSKGKLLVETKDDGSSSRQSWKSSDFKADKTQIHLQKCRSENLEEKLAKISEFESNRLKNKYVKRCRSDTLTDSVLPSRRKNRSSEAVISSSRSRNKDKGVLDEVLVDRPSTQRTLNERLRDIEQRRLYGLQKSKSDVIDIQVKSKPSQHVQRPYHRRTGSDDLFQKSWHKYNLKESLKRAERDGYKNFLDTTPYRACSVDRSTDRNRKKPIPGCLETAETVFCNNKPQNFEIKNVEKPKRYRLRQSRAGILVISDESFSSSHRKRCHGDLGDCREDSSDVIIEGDLTSSVEDLNELRKRPIPDHGRPFRQASDPAGVWTARLPTNRYGIGPRTMTSTCPDDVRAIAGRGQSCSYKTPGSETQLFYSKSDVFPFHHLTKDCNPPEEKKYRDLPVEMDANCNYIVQEPLTTPNSESGKDIAEEISKRRRRRIGRRYTDGSTSSSTALDEIQTGPLVRSPRTQETSERDLLRLVRRLSTSTPSKTDSSAKDPEEGRNFDVDTRNVDRRHVRAGVMGANVSRHSTKGLSGRRSQSSGSICNGKGRHQGDGSGKGSGGSLPSYLDDRESSSCNNNYGDDAEKSSLDEVERIPPLGDGAPLHWKFSDAQTALCQDQGYGSERSPEEEYPPPLPDHELNQCHHHLEPHSCYPFITPESTFSVKLAKGTRGLGLSVTGGVDSAGSWPGLVRIKRLFPHQPASSCGLLNVGDLLLEANGVPLTGLTNYEALDVLRTASNQVELRVCRPPPDVLNCVSPISEVPPPPPTRREPPNSLNLAGNCYGTTPEDEYYHGEFEITLTKIQGSLGFTLRKEDDSALGHYVRALVREPALTDGRIKAGDKIIAVNEVEISPMSHEQAVQYLRQCGDKVKLKLYRDSAQTPVATLSPTETTPRASFSRKANLRQEAVDMLNDIAVRKLLPSNLQEPPGHRSSSPRRLRRHNCPSDASQDSSSSGIKYLIPEEQFHEGLLKCAAHFEEDAYNSLFSIDSEDMDRPSRPSSLDLYNPNQTPVATRKPRFNFSLAHNAYELNNLDPEVLDAPNLAYNLGVDDGSHVELENKASFPSEPASMPHIPLEGTSSTFSYKNPAYQSAHPPCVETDARSSSSTSKSSQNTHKDEETDTIKRKKGILKKDTERRPEMKVDGDKMTPMKEDYEILAIELNRGWNSRLGFSLQGAAGVTYVSAVHADSVAAKDGRIRPGDRIIKVNDESVDHMNTNEIIDLLRIVRGPVCIVVKRIKSNQDCSKSNAEN